MKLKPKKTPQAEVMALFNKALEEYIFEKKDPKRVLSLRCSGLPYCVNNAVQGHLTGGYTAMDLRFSFYVRVGHAVHDVLQTYLPRVGKFYADYECKKCKTIHRLSTKTRCCGVSTKYHELGLKLESKLGTLEGHVDALVLLSDGYYVVDFKTTGVSGMASKGETNPLGYERQLEAYCYLIERQYGIRCKGAMLFYIQRDNPIKIKLSKTYTYTDEDKKRIKRSLKQDLTRHHEVMNLSSAKEYSRLMKFRCGGEFCDSCKLDDASLLSKFKANKSMFPIKEFYEQAKD